MLRPGVIAYPIEWKSSGYSYIGNVQDRSLFNGPFGVMVAYFLIAVTSPFAGGFFFRPDQPGLGGKVLDQRES